MFGYFEAPESLQAALDRMSAAEINTRWQEYMASYFEGVGAHPDQMMIELEEIFHLD